MIECIRAIHAQLDATYGMPRVRAEPVRKTADIAKKSFLVRLLSGSGILDRRTLPGVTGGVRFHFGYIFKLATPPLR